MTFTAFAGLEGLDTSRAQNEDVAADSSVKLKLAGRDWVVFCKALISHGLITPPWAWCACYIRPEFSAPVLDCLRQPLETGDVLIARANFHVRYPARFQLVAAMNPCRCGYGRASGRACGKGPNCEEIYQSRISGPLIDRMDLAIELPAVTPADLAAPGLGETTAEVASRVAAAREAQYERARPSGGPGGKDGVTNAALADADLAAVAEPDAEGASLLSRAAESLGLSARAYMRILRVARTLADLDGGDGVRRRHIAEAVSFRRREKAGPVKTGAGPAAGNAAPLARRAP